MHVAISCTLLAPHNRNIKSCRIFFFWGGGREEIEAGEQIPAKTTKTGNEISE